jgi:[protein-PII] uridylyltransferase
MPLSPADIADLRQAYRGDKAGVLAQIAALPPSSLGIHGLLRRLSRHTDSALTRLWQGAGLPASFALIGVGGYGRGELFPYSDIDVLLLVPEGIDLDGEGPVRAALESFITACWDAGLEIGSSVRTQRECLDAASEDITVRTSLLENRWIAGSRPAWKQLDAALQSAMDAPAFFTAKMLEMRQRHQKFEDTPYALEPNSKESPGGLRDLQIILWVARAAGLGRTWGELGRSGMATPLEVRRLKANEALLSLVRARLHLLARRREDRLLFDLQATLAESFGDQPEAPEPGDVGRTRGARRASERLMRRYYWAAKAVAQLNQVMLLNIQDRLEPAASAEPLRINERFHDRAGMLEVATDDLYERHPHAILETFLLFQSAPGIQGLSARTLRALYNARPLMNAAFRRDPVNRATFLQILQQPEGVMHALRLMNQTSVLGRYLWVFRRTVGQMQHDLFHVYTVDQHILMVLRNMRRFFMAEHSHEYPFCSQLAAGWDKPWLLYLAALFHDIAKGRGGDHSSLGARDVRTFCRQHGVDGADTEVVAFVVAEHLTMSRVAQKEDLSDPDVIGAFAARVGNERRLTALYLLTVADIRGTSPKVWNGWKGRLLEDLYRSTLRVLGGRSADPDAVVEARKREALTIMARQTLPHLAHQALWAQLDLSYFMRHKPDEIAWHTRQLSRPLAQLPAGAPHPTLVRARLSPEGEGLQVLVYTADQPDLFARICGYFDHADYSILDAKVHTTRDGHALDTFQVVAPALSEHYRELIAMVESTLARTIDARDPLPNPSQGRLSRRVKSFPVAPRVDLHPDEKAQRWVLNVSASDRAGLLYRIARVLATHQVHLQLAKIATLGERVEDTFLISGPTLQYQRERIELETDLLEVLKNGA